MQPGLRGPPKKKGMCKMKKSKTLLALTLALSMLLAGCSGAAQTSGEEAAETEGKSISIGLTLAQSSLDPVKTVDGSSMIAESVIFDTLVDSRGGMPTVIEPMLASSWTVSDDGTEYVFTLREGVKFHDGTEMTAEDVVFTLERCMEEPVSASHFECIDTVEATGDYEVKVTLNSPNSMFLPSLGKVEAGIVSKAAVEAAGGDYMFEPIGTGPYMLDGECKSGQPFTLKAFDEYWGEKPDIDSVTYKVLPDSSTAVIALQNGEIDVLPDLNVNDLETVKNDENLKVIEQASNWFVHLTFNKTEAPFNDIRVRQALELAINKQDVLDAAYNGAGELANSPLCSIMTGYTEDLEFNKYNLEEAKKLMAEAGYADGFSTTILVRTDRSYIIKVAQVLQSEFAELGINLEIKELERAAWNEAQSTVNFDISIGALNWADSSSMLGFLYRSDGDHNFDKTYNNPEVDALLNEALQTSDLEKAGELYTEVVKLADEDKIVIPLFFPNDLMGLNKNLDGVVLGVNVYQRVNEWTLAE